MFSFIVSVMSIIIVVVLVIATMYYGGTETLTEGQKEAQVAQALNEMGQIRSASLRYNATEGKYPDTLSDLVPDYMTALPPGWGDAAPPELASLLLESRKIGGPEAGRLQVCNSINERMGVPSPAPTCDSLPQKFTGCCVSP